MNHPIIEQIMRTGYPNMEALPEHVGIDYFGDEILDGETQWNMKVKSS